MVTDLINHNILLIDDTDYCSNIDDSWWIKKMLRWTGKQFRYGLELVININQMKCTWLMWSYDFIFKENQVKRPGRNLITFLIVANLSLWLWETMEAKASGEYYHIRKTYYGAEVAKLIIYYWDSLKNKLGGDIIFLITFALVSALDNH